jgi:hypothetical protein
MIRLLRIRASLFTESCFDTGATLRDQELEELHDFSVRASIQLISDEVYHLFTTVEKRRQQVVFRDGILSAVPEFVMLARTLQPNHSQT